MKNVFATVLASLVAIGCVGCGGNEQPPQQAGESKKEPNAQYDFLGGGKKAGAGKQSEAARAKAAEGEPSEVDTSDEGKKTWKGKQISTMSREEAMAATVEISRETCALSKQMTDAGSVRKNVKKWIALSVARAEASERLGTFHAGNTPLALDWAQKGWPEVAKLMDEEGKEMKRIHSDKALQAAWIQGSITGD